VATGVSLPVPSVADALYLAAYGLLLAGLVVLIRERSQGRIGRGCWTQPSSPPASACCRGST
jgi:hypothetical protein